MCNISAKSKSLIPSPQTRKKLIYLIIQASSLSAFVISKTHVSGQKPLGRQQKCAIAKVPFCAFFHTTFVQTTITQNSSSTRLDFSTQEMLITACSFPMTQRLHSLKFTVVYKSHSQHSVASEEVGHKKSNLGVG